MSELTSPLAIRIAQGRDLRHAFVTTINGDIYVDTHHRNIVNNHGIDLQDRVDAGRFVGDSLENPSIEVVVFSIEIDIPKEQENRDITVARLKELVADHTPPIRIQVGRY